ncbi:MAG: TIGR03016 family PEP-CTERM system-associated outer membrane protein [Sulfuricella sp.]|nr:TIGR03016 family PEP-CTERM system-associated outer membrane protein [Sulfuricella sp.]
MAITTAKSTRNRLRAACSAAAILLLPAHAIAAEWTIVPSLDLKETYSDNITLAPRGYEQSDFVTQVIPGISLTGTGPRLRVNARYAMQNLFYAQESNRNTINHMLNANANAELVDNLLFMDGLASISQQNISLTGPQAADNVNVTGNRTEVKTYSLSPYLRHSFGNTASSELRYTHSAVSSGVGGLADSQTDRINLGINSGSAFRTVGWGLNYSNQKTAYDNSASTLIQSRDNEVISGNLRYMVTSRFSLKATGGYEKNDYISIGTKPEGSFWSGGFSWTPGPLTSIDASAGKRFFGNTYSLAASHRTRLTAWNIAYNEDITSTQSQFLLPPTIDTSGFLNQLWAATIPDPVARQQIVDSFIQANGLPLSLAESLNYLTNRLFLQKSLRASVALTGARNTLVLSLFNTSRNAQTAQAQDSILFGSSNLALSDKTRQVGGNALWNWRLGPRTSANINAGYTRMSYPELDRTDNDKTLRFSLVRQIQPKLSGAVELRRLQRDSSQSIGTYRENAVTASLHMSF